MVCVPFCTSAREDVTVKVVFSVPTHRRVLHVPSYWTVAVEGATDEPSLIDTVDHVVPTPVNVTQPCLA